MEAASAMSMDRLFGKIKQLPTIPQLLHELMQSFNDENARIDEIAAKIAMDQVISVKVLRMANSAALRRGNEVTSIEQAVIRLGFNRLRSVVVASGIISSFKAPPGFDKHRFWTQTFQVATIARTLAQQTKAVDPESAFTCALIHNIGELLIQSTLPEEAGLINLAIEKGSSRVEAQREMLGYDYAQLGAELAKRWNLSSSFVDAIAQQLDIDAIANAVQRHLVCLVDARQALARDADQHVGVLELLAERAGAGAAQRHHGHLALVRGLDRTEYLGRLRQAGDDQQGVARLSQRAHLARVDRARVEGVVEPGEDGGVAAQCECRELGPVALEAADEGAREGLHQADRGPVAAGQYLAATRDRSQDGRECGFHGRCQTLGTLILDIGAVDELLLDALQEHGADDKPGRLGARA